LRKTVKKGGFHKGDLIQSRGGKVTDNWEMNTKGKNLGEGSFGTVVKGVNKSSKKQAAIKIVSKDTLKNIERFRQEIEVMKTLDHPNIIKLYETYEDQKNIYLIMEMATGGELFDRVVSVKFFSEVQAAHVIQQILRGINYMHGAGVVHRDLKPENFLFSNNDPIEKSTLKVIDFGLSTPFKRGVPLTTKAGTPYYVAPDVLKGSYDERSDLWSIGVIMYVLLCGYPPFYAANDRAVLQKVMKGQFEFKPRDWSGISREARSLISHLITLDVDARYTAQQALKDPWIDKKAPGASKESLNSSSKFVGNLRAYRSNNKLKKMALAVIAQEMNEKQIKALRDVFIMMDNNQDGLLTREELRAGIKKSGIAIPADLGDIMNTIDCDGSGFVEYSEFIAAALDRRAYMEEKAAWQAFSRFDLDKNGKISRQELKKVIYQDYGDRSIGFGGVGKRKSVDSLIQKVDVDGDGEIDFKEFMAMMRQK